MAHYCVEWDVRLCCTHSFMYRSTEIEDLPTDGRIFEDCCSSQALTKGFRPGGESVSRSEMSTGRVDCGSVRVGSGRDFLLNYGGSDRVENSRNLLLSAGKFIRFIMLLVHTIFTRRCIFKISRELKKYKKCINVTVFQLFKLLL